LTWHDEDSDVVCLLRVGWHESGSVDDAYAVLKARDQAGTLMPNEQDYQEAPALVDQARQTPGREVRGVWSPSTSSSPQHLFP